MTYNEEKQSSIETKTKPKQTRVTLKEVAENSKVLTKAVTKLGTSMGLPLNLKGEDTTMLKKLALPGETKMKAINNLTYHKIDGSRQHLNA